MVKLHKTAQHSVPKDHRDNMHLTGGTAALRRARFQAFVVV
jgi:hypothetical protein